MNTPSLTQEWSEQFSHKNFDEIMFKTEDGVYFAVMTKAELERIWMFAAPSTVTFKRSSESELMDQTSLCNQVNHISFGPTIYVKTNGYEDGKTPYMDGEDAC